jgi:hypothetical protein
MVAVPAGGMEKDTRVRGTSISKVIPLPVPGKINKNNRML